MAKKRHFSILIVPHSKESFKRVTLSHKAVKTILAGAAALFIVLAAFLADYLTMSVTRQKYKKLREENIRQQETLAGYEDSLKKMSAVIQNFESYTKKLNVMAGLKSPDVIKDVGVGGGSSNGEELVANESGPPPAQISPGSIQDLNQKAEGIEKNLDTLVGFFEAESMRLASTPTIWPTMGWVTSPFGWRDDSFTGKRTFHYGMDIATNFGNQVVATADGIVAALRTEKIGGRIIIISHGNGVTTQYMHLDKFLVKAGQKVKRGDPIGLVGRSGKATGPHVHYEVKINDKSVNPYNYILEE